MEKRKMHHPNESEESKKGKCLEGSTSKLNKIHHTNARCKETGADVELSSKSNDIKLLCGQPNSSKQIDFQVLPGVCDRQFYNLDSFLHDKHYILRHNHQKRYILTHTKYCLTLKEWLEKNTNNWCPIYRNWNVNRPTEEAKKLIQCILQAVYDLHARNIFHGFLHHPENFFIKRDHHKKIKLVYLAYENMKPKTSAKKKKKSNDILDISDMIFGQILRGGIVREYPEDLQDLYDWLSPDSRQDWTFIVDHPSLWHWKLRFNYIERVWMQYQHADSDLQVEMQYSLRTIREGFNWRNNINPNTPLERMFNYQHYDETPKGLLKYIRNVHVHYKDRNVEIDPRTEADYLEEQFIEHKTTQVCELFLVYLHRMVCNLGIEI